MWRERHVGFQQPLELEKWLVVEDDPIDIAQPNATGLKMAVDAKEMLGDVEWQGADNGKIIARLKRLSIPNAASSAVKAKTKTEFRKQAFRKQAQAYPALDVLADNFEISGKN